MKNKFLFTILSALVTLPMMAETATINPTWEANYRTKDNTPTGWTTVTTTADQFEVYNGARFFAVQTWQIANISKVTSLKFVYTRVTGQTNNGDLSMWAFPYNSMVTSTANFSTDGMAFLNDVKTVLGVYPGNTITTTPLAFSSIEGTGNATARTITLDATAITALKAAGSISDDVLTVNVLLNTVNATNNYKYYHTAAETAPASYCTVSYAPIQNDNTKVLYTDLATAVAAATAGDVLVLNDSVTISGARLEIKKALTIQGATGAEKIICGVNYNTLMVLANDNSANYDVTFKNLVVDGKNVNRSTQMFDANNKGRLVFENVKVINSQYSVVTGDVKSNNREVVLRGDNSFATGIYLNRGKRIANENTTHTTPIRVILAGDYEEDYAVVTTCDNAALYEVVGADGTKWMFYETTSGSTDELKGRKACKLTVSDAKMATLVIGYDAAIPTGVQAYTLTNNGSEYIVAEEVFSITANEPVLIVAEADDYTFDCEVGTVLNEQANPTNGCLVGTYEMNPVTIAQMTGNNYNYILAKGQNDVVGFYQVLADDYKIGRYHAYLSCAHNHNAVGTAMRLVFHKVPTALENAEVAAPAEKFLMNGTLYIRREGRLYTIDGQVVK